MKQTPQLDETSANRTIWPWSRVIDILLRLIILVFAIAISIGGGMAIAIKLIYWALYPESSTIPCIGLLE